MSHLVDVDWSGAFVPDTALLEMVVRGSLTYLAIFVLLRLLRRESSDVALADLLVIVLVADAAQNAMAASYTSITDGLVLVATIVAWSYALDWLAYRFPTLERLIHPPPVVLVRDGQMQRRNMRKELLTENELMAQLREQGIDDLSIVKRAHMEADGRVSVLRTDEGPAQSKERRIA